jgi:integrase
VVEVKEALDQSGINSAQYSGHSFRSGAATTAVRRGMGDAMIQMLGRWKSDAYRAYIKTPTSQLAAISRIFEKGPNK